MWRLTGNVDGQLIDAQGEWGKLSALAVSAVEAANRMGREHDAVRKYLEDGPREMSLSGETFSLLLKEIH